MINQEEIDSTLRKALLATLPSLMLQLDLLASLHGLCGDEKILENNFRSACNSFTDDQLENLRVLLNDMRFAVYLDIDDRNTIRQQNEAREQEQLELKNAQKALDDEENKNV